MPLALVTGGGRRLGACICARLAEAGYSLAIHSRDGAAPEAWLVERLEGISWIGVSADLSDANAVAELPRIVAERAGQGIDLLVNCASRFAALDEPDSCYRSVVDHVAANVAAPIALATAVATGGRDVAIVNILDQRIVNPPRDQVAYTVSKQALSEATRTLAVALAPGARVNAVAPGLILPTKDYAEGQVDRVGTRMPLSRNAEPREVADAVLWLASARAVTGQVIFVDGGAHLRSFDRDFVHLER